MIYLFASKWRNVSLRRLQESKRRTMWSTSCSEMDGIWSTELESQLFIATVHLSGGAKCGQKPQIFFLFIHKCLKEFSFTVFTSSHEHEFPSPPLFHRHNVAKDLLILSSFCNGRWWWKKIRIWWFQKHQISSWYTRFVRSAEGPVWRTSEPANFEIRSSILLHRTSRRQNRIGVWYLVQLIDRSMLFVGSIKLDGTIKFSISFTNLSSSTSKCPLGEILQVSKASRCWSL